MIKTIIIDDEQLSRELIKAYLRAYPDIEIVQECADGFEAIKAILLHQPDLIFLDIQMPKISGFEMLELLDTLPSIIFITAYDEYAIRAFETNAIDYLLKPFPEPRFRKAIDKFLEKFSVPEDKTQKVLAAMSHSPAQQNRIVVKTGTKVKIIPIQDILYIEADDDYARIVTAEGAFLKNKTMQFYEQVLDSQQFIRVHRSYLIPIVQITRIDPYQKDSHLVVLRNGQQIPVSKSGYSKLKSALGI